jgi:hypothetical protein
MRIRKLDCQVLDMGCTAWSRHRLGAQDGVPLRRPDRFRTRGHIPYYTHTARPLGAGLAERTQLIAIAHVASIFLYTEIVGFLRLLVKHRCVSCPTALPPCGDQYSGRHLGVAFQQLRSAPICSDLRDLNARSRSPRRPVRWRRAVRVDRPRPVRRRHTLTPGVYQVVALMVAELQTADFCWNVQIRVWVALVRVLRKRVR